MIAYNLFDKLHVTGGSDASFAEHDAIWTSSDAAVWTQEVEHAAFGPRTDAAVLVFNSKV